MKRMKVGLCEGRHEMPVSEYIFPSEVNPIDLDGMHSTIDRFFTTHIEWGMHLRGLGTTDELVYTSNDSVDLYVSGLTVAVAEVIRYCHVNYIALTLYHYDRETGEYYPQIMY